MNKRQKQAMQTKENLVKAALYLMREKGFPNLTIRDLCQCAEVSIGTFYHYFSSKEDIINQGFGFYDLDLEEYLQTYVQTNPNPIRAIYDIIMNQTRYVADRTAGFTKELYIGMLSIREGYATKDTRKYYQTILYYTKEAVKQGLFGTEKSAEELTEFMIRTNRGDIIDWCLHDYEYDLLKRAQEDLFFILKGLLRDGAGTLESYLEEESEQ